MNKNRMQFPDFSQLLLFCLAGISSFSCANDARFGNLGNSESKEVNGSSNRSRSAEKNPFTYPASTDVVEVGNPGDQPSPGTGPDARKLNLYFDLPDSGRYFAMRIYIQRVVFSFENGSQIERSFSPAVSAFFGPTTQNETNNLIVDLVHLTPNNNIKGLKIQLDRNGEVDLFESNNLTASIKKRVEGAYIDVGNSNIIDTGAAELNSKISLAFEENSGSEFVTFTPKFVSGGLDLKIFTGKASCQDGAYFYFTECVTRSDVIEKIFGFCDGKVSPLSGKTGVELFVINETCK